MQCAYGTEPKLLDPFFDRFPFDESDGTTIVRGYGEIQGQAQFVVHRRDDVFREVFVRFGHTTFGVGFAEDQSAGYACAGHDHKTGRGPVISADCRIDLWCSPKVRHPNNKGRIEQSLLLEIDQQGWERLVDLRHTMLFESIEAVLMVVPAWITDGHESDAGLDQAAGEQQALTERSASIIIAQFGVFASDVERLAGLWSRDHLERGFVVFVEGIECGGLKVRGALHPIDFAQDLTASIDPRQLHVHWRRDVADRELVHVGFGVDFKAGMFQTQDAWQSTLERAIDVGAQLDEWG